MNIAVVVSFERLPLWHLGSYGRVPSPTPHLDRFAAESVVFDWHFAENVDPDAARHAWWTGRYQFPFSRAAQEQQPDALVDALTSAGIDTVGICETASEANRRCRTMTWRETPASPASQELFRKAAAAISTTDGDRRLCWVHSSLEFSLSESPAAMERRIRAMDDAFGRFIASVQRSQGDELLLIVTAATGVPADGPDADRLPENVRRIAECNVHTPLIVNAGCFDGGLRQSSLVQSVDLAPTLLEWFGVPFDASEFDGRSLLPLLRHDAVTPLREAVYFGDGRRGCGIRTHELCLLCPRGELASGDDPAFAPPNVRLFIKPDDAWEVHNVAAQELDTVDRLLAQLAAVVQRASGEPLPEP